jgi:ParB family transcriptional regulator, chromosome partitioning protein
MDFDNKAARRPALGRGLAALIPQGGSASSGGGAGAVLQIPIERIQPERNQPRKRFDATALAELAASIREKGVLQPILVRRAGSDYRIIAGERRWRAAQKAGLHQIPALVKDLGDEAAFEVALIENLQREDLDPLEEAEAYRRLCEDHGLTQEEAASRVGKDRSSVANAMRLLRLPEEIRAAIAAGELDMGHARALLAVRDEARLLKLARQAIEQRLSVREVERLARGERPGGATGKTQKPEATAAVRREEEALVRALGTRVHIQERKGRGTIQIEFASHDEYARLSELLLHKAGR